MKKLGIAVALGLTLAGCVSARDEEYARLQASVQEASAACKAAADAKKFRTHTAHAQCIANAQAPLAVGPNADLHRLKLAQMVAIAEQVDRKQLTETQAIAELAKADASINSEIQSRNNASRVVAAQEQAARAASSPVYCNRIGNSVSCF